MNVKLIVRWLLNAVALMLLPELIDSLQVISALMLGLVNALIRPLLILVTLPITLLTLGLFTLVINALLFWFVSSVVAGFQVPDFATAFWGALIYSILTWLVNIALTEPAHPPR